MSTAKDIWASGVSQAIPGFAGSRVIVVSATCQGGPQQVVGRLVHTTLTYEDVGDILGAIPGSVYEDDPDTWRAITRLYRVMKGDADATWEEAVHLTRADVLAQCREARGHHEVSAACARAIMRIMAPQHTTTVEAFIRRGELPPARGKLDGGTILWREVFRQYEWMTPDDRLLGDMLGTFFHHTPEEAPHGTV